MSEETKITNIYLFHFAIIIIIYVIINIIIIIIISIIIIILINKAFVLWCWVSTNIVIIECYILKWQ